MPKFVELKRKVSSAAAGLSTSPFKDSSYVEMSSASAYKEVFDYQLSKPVSNKNILTMFRAFESSSTQNTEEEEEEEEEEQ